MSEKKDAAITLHIPSDLKKELDELGSLVREGMGAGEYARDVVMAHVRQLRYETEVKARIFNLKGN